MKRCSRQCYAPRLHGHRGVKLSTLPESEWLWGDAGIWRTIVFMPPFGRSVVRFEPGVGWSLNGRPLSQRGIRQSIARSAGEDR